MDSVDFENRVMSTRHAKFSNLHLRNINQHHRKFNRHHRQFNRHHLSFKLDLPILHAPSNPGVKNAIPKYLIKNAIPKYICLTPHLGGESVVQSERRRLSPKLGGVEVRLIQFFLSYLPINNRTKRNLPTK